MGMRGNIHNVKVGDSCIRIRNGIHYDAIPHQIRGYRFTVKSVEFNGVKDHNDKFHIFPNFILDQEEPQWE
jgi:hypothetical protein